MSTFGGLTPTAIGVLRDLRKANRLTEVAVVRAARASSNPLHPYFEWDDSRAAEQYRLGQARILIARVRVVIDMGKGKTVTVPAYIHSRAEAAYVETERASMDVIQEAITDARDELDRFHDRHQALLLLAKFRRGIAPSVERLLVARK